jgi:hypothetical protein
MNYEKFSAENAAMLLIDHQVGTEARRSCSSPRFLAGNSLACSI